MTLDMIIGTRYRRTWSCMVTLVTEPMITVVTVVI